MEDYRIKKLFLETTMEKMFDTSSIFHVKYRATQNFCFLYFSSVLQVLAKSLFLEEDWELGYLSHSATREAARIYHIYY